MRHIDFGADGWIQVRAAGTKATRERAAALADAAPTPEYVAGWLAGREQIAAGLADMGHHVLAAAVRQLAPPSAPPVNEYPPSEPFRSMHVGKAALALAEAALAGPPAPSINEDRMLLLKALCLRVVTVAIPPQGSPRYRLTFPDGRVWVEDLDAEGFPILTDSLRAALTEATEANQ